MAANLIAGLVRYLSRVATFFLLPVGVWLMMVLWDTLHLSFVAGAGLSISDAIVYSVDNHSVTALMTSVLAYAVGLAGHLSQSRPVADDQRPHDFFAGVLQLLIALTAAFLFALVAVALRAVTDQMTWPRSVSIIFYFAAAGLACIAATGAWLKIR